MTTFYDGDSSEVRKGSAYARTVKCIRPSSESGPRPTRNGHRKYRPYDGNGSYIPHSSEFTEKEFGQIITSGKTASLVRQELRDINNFYEAARDNKDLLSRLLKGILVFKRNLQIYRANPKLVEKKLLRILPELGSQVNAIEKRVNSAFSSALEELRVKRTFGKPRLYALEDALKDEDE